MLLFQLPPGRRRHSICHGEGELYFRGSRREDSTDNNIPLDFTNRQMSDKEIEDAKHRESLMAALDVAQKFFYDSLRITFSDEARNAQAYAYGRWPEEFCSTFGVGYAPKDGRAFMEYCKRKAVDTDLLIELGLLKRDKEDKEKIYTAFRERVIIPIRNRWGESSLSPVDISAPMTRPQNISIPTIRRSTPKGYNLWNRQGFQSEGCRQCHYRRGRAGCHAL